MKKIAILLFLILTECSENETSIKEKLDHEFDIRMRAAGFQKKCQMYYRPDGYPSTENPGCKSWAWYPPKEPTICKKISVYPGYYEDCINAPIP